MVSINWHIAGQDQKRVLTRPPTDVTRTLWDVRKVRWRPGSYLNPPRSRFNSGKRFHFFTFKSSVSKNNFAFNRVSLKLIIFGFSSLIIGSNFSFKNRYPWYWPTSRITIPAGSWIWQIRFVYEPLELFQLRDRPNFRVKQVQFAFCHNFESFSFVFHGFSSDMTRVSTHKKWAMDFGHLVTPEMETRFRFLEVKSWASQKDIILPSSISWFLHESLWS